MKFHEIENKLKPDSKLEIKNGWVFIDSEPLDGILPVEILTAVYGEPEIKIDRAAAMAGGGPREIRIKGETSFSLLRGPTEVFATLELVGNPETLALTLRYPLTQGWLFEHSFPGLPYMADYDSQKSSYLDGQRVLASFRLEPGNFYFTTYPHTLHDDGLGGDVFLEQGLTIAGCWAPQGMFGLLDYLVTSPNASHKILSGPVVLRPTGTPLPLEDGQFPWSSRPRIPGIHLQANLGLALSFPPGSGKMELKALRFHVYSPLSLFPPDGVPGYRFAMAYAGDLFIPSIKKDDKFATLSAAQSLGSKDEFVIAGAFDGLTLDNLAGVLKRAGEDDSPIILLPEGVRDGIGTLGVRNASITVFKSETGYEVATTSFTIAMAADAKPWSLFDGFIQLKFESLAISIVKPFDADARAVYGAIAATATFAGVQLYAEVQYPGFYLSARQVGKTTIDLSPVSKGLCLPDYLGFQFDIADIAVVVQPGSYYFFSMRLGPDASWKIDGRYTLPDVRLAVRCETPQTGKTDLSWRFGARTREGDEAVPVFLLAEKLFEQVGVKNLQAPKAIKKLTIHSLELSYEVKDKVFAAECWGQLPINDSKLQFGLTIAHTSGEQPATDFGGQFLLSSEGQEPLSFSVRFGETDNSKYFLAAYHDPNGYRLNIQSLAKSVLSAEQAALIPASLEISLESALVAYSQQGQGEEEESAVLFGADLGVSIQLSDLPIVGSALRADRTIGFESLRVLVASARLGEESVEKLNELFPKGMKPLPDGTKSDGKGSEKKGLAKGFHVSAVLLFGDTPQTLTLPFGGEDKPVAKPPAMTPPAQPNIQPSTAAPAPPAPAASVKWFDIDKSLGPVTVRRIGLSYDAEQDKAKAKVGIKFDAGLALSVLTFNLDGLGVNYALGSSTEPAEILKNLDFTLDGMGLALASGPIEIGGSLVRVPGAHLELEGTLLIRSAAFSFSALGSYVDLNGSISVMAFAVLLKELGDPTGTGGFVVTGLAFGFGVNRKLTLPPIEKVQDFPLVQAAMGKQDFQSLKELPRQLRDYVAPSVGDFWIAAGIKINSFVVLDSFLLLSVSWGAEIEIGLLGLSRMTVPPLVQPKDAIAGAELALRGVIGIAEGLIQFEARLTENSFIFSRSCRLTGGFAFCVWFAGPHKGDFMVSLGGYHPAFQRPLHYPLVPRLGMQLQIGSTLSITGEAYFALTPSCMMAGGRLCAVFKSGAIEAWFIAYADFLMSWAPFYYQAAMGITLGIALRLGSLRIRLELSVELKLQGPPFGGEARVTLWIISFTIPFGTLTSAPPPLTAPDFVKKCLPPARTAAVDASPEVFSIRINTGLLREQEIKSENRTARVVNAHRLSLSVQSVIPCTKFEGVAKDLAAASPCGIRPMGKINLQSTFRVTVEGTQKERITEKQISVSVITGNVPDAVWGKSEKEGVVPLPKTPERKTIEAALGVRIDSIQQAPVDSLPAIPIARFQYEDLPKRVDWSVEKQPEYVLVQTRWSEYSGIWNDDAVKRERDGVLKFLRRHMPDELMLHKPELEQMSACQDYFQQQPEIVRWSSKV